MSHDGDRLYRREVLAELRCGVAGAGGVCPAWRGEMLLFGKRFDETRANIKTCEQTGEGLGDYQSVPTFSSI